MRRRSAPWARPLRAAALGLLLLLGTVAATPIPAVAATQTSVEEVARQLMDPCENCKGKLLSSCDCGPAATLKQEIAQKVEAGLTADQIVAAVVAERGEWLRAAPPKSGFNLLGWLLPFVLIAAGGFGIWAFLRTAVAGAKGPRATPVDSGPRPAASSESPRPLVEAAAVVGATPAAANEDPERYRKQLDEELRRMER